MIRIQTDSAAVLDALGELLRRAQDLRPALIEIGERMAASTQARFASGTAPDGTPWADNRPVTEALYAAEFASAGAKRPLIGKSRRLSGEISWQLLGGDAVEIGSPMPYAAMQQFGGTTAPGSMIPGKTIPARPYLGLSDQDERDILDIVARYLRS